MSEQNFKNHRKVYPLHHFIFYPVILVALLISVKGISEHPDERINWILITVLVLLIGWLSFMTRQHYALILQNRTVRLEMRLRYFQLTGKRLEEIEEQLGFKKIAALRFASDKELPALIDKTIRENLSPSSIKKQIQHWYPDHMRV